MKDITDAMLDFKEALRHSWNTYFARGDSEVYPEIQEAFESVEIGLFQGLVLSPLGVSVRADEYRRRPLSFIQVRPVEILQELPLSVGTKDENNNTIWGTQVSIPINEKLSLHFFDYFDWHPYGRVDLPYVRAQLVSSSTHPNFCGAMVLIEQRCCRFYFAP